LITQISGGTQAAVLSQSLARQQEASVYNVAELRVGLNPQAGHDPILLWFVST
jgi:hypothetical protein